MPGLLRGVARTAVIAGTATSVSNRVSRRQGERWARQEAAAQPVYQQPQPVYQQAPPAYAPPPQAPPAASTEDRIAALKQLGDLRAQGVLTDAEFDAEKRRILGS
ncbi:SHOCT domain-containing protein [Gordonia sp. NPDC003429]